MSYDPNNVFAKILRNEIPCTEVYRDEHVLAFHDLHPAAPVHVLVVPNGEFVSFNDFAAKGGSETVARFFAIVQRIAEQLGVATTGYRLITNHGADASQTVPHFHVHILGGRPLGGLVTTDSLTR